MEINKNYNQEYLKFLGMFLHAMALSKTCVIFFFFIFYVPMI